MNFGSEMLQVFDQSQDHQANLERICNSGASKRDLGPCSCQDLKTGGILLMHYSHGNQFARRSLFLLSHDYLTCCLAALQVFLSVTERAYKK